MRKWALGVATVLLLSSGCGNSSDGGGSGGTDGGHQTQDVDRFFFAPAFVLKGFVSSCEVFYLFCFHGKISFHLFTRLESFRPA